MGSPPPVSVGRPEAEVLMQGLKNPEKRDREGLLQQGDLEVRRGFFLQQGDLEVGETPFINREIWRSGRHLLHQQGDLEVGETPFSPTGRSGGRGDTFLTNRETWRSV
jgi:hypothetical protein